MPSAHFPYVHETKASKKRFSHSWANVISFDSSIEQARKKLSYQASRYLSMSDIFTHSGYYEREEATQTFVTGSEYTGEWNGVGMWGWGNYVLPHKKHRPRVHSLSLDWENVVTKMTVSRNSLDSPCSQVTHPGFLRIEKSSTNFCTDSVYTGQWDVIGMNGFGNYKMPHQVEYEGEMQDGMFHGEGTLTYPMGQKIDGEWVKGKLVSFKFRFADGLEYYTPWKYCKMPDRRFYTSIQEGMRPAGRSLLTNQDPPRKIPEGCYDTGDGFYNPKTKCVTSAIYPDKILRIPTAAEEKWIMENCRKAWDEPTGYRPDLYERWVSGRRTDSYPPSEDESDSSSTSSNAGSLLDANNYTPLSQDYDASRSNSPCNWWEQNSDDSLIENGT